jgi:RNA polymerase sigma factor (TIGR02999 family)
MCAHANPRPKPELDRQPVFAEQLSASLYQELHRIAAGKMRRERQGHTLQPTALINEAFLRLENQPGSIWRGDRSRLLGFAANTMRQILVDHARARLSAKRGDGRLQISLEEISLASDEKANTNVLVIDEALSHLAKFDEKQAKILEMHFFGGLSFEEIAIQLGVSTRTVKREWTMARAWLRKHLSPSI